VRNRAEVMLRQEAMRRRMLTPAIFIKPIGDGSFEVEEAITPEEQKARDNFDAVYSVVIRQERIATTGRPTAEGDGS
jgi:hypothetical protein